MGFFSSKKPETSVPQGVFPYIPQYPGVYDVAPHQPPAAPYGSAPTQGYVGSTLPAFTKDRVRNFLEQEKISYRVDEDGDISASWESAIILFLVSGKENKILQVRGLWRPDLAIDDMQKALTVCNKWNADKFFPKTYVFQTKTGVVQVVAETTMDCSDGITDEQLISCLNGGIAFAIQFFDSLEEVFPGRLAACLSR
ncbi:MAG: YbjN domain-containing protein [Propionibacteriaceae bacterium]